jgi:hypothetical protein
MPQPTASLVKEQQLFNLLHGDNMPICEKGKQKFSLRFLLL